MSTFRAALRGTSWALVAQVVIGVGQIAYSALTARLFSPHAFGEFTAALSLYGLIVLCTGAGLTSFVLKEPHLNRSQVRSITLVSILLALSGAAVFWFVSPVWLAWLNSPGGIEFVPLLTWAAFAAPIATIQWALLRREGDGRTDAAVYILAFIVSTGLATVCTILIREPWTLALGSAVNPMIVAPLSRGLRRAAYPAEESRLAFDWLVFGLRVTGQNLVFLGLGQVPTWSLGASTGPATLGEFSRGNTLAYLPTNALTTAMVSGTAPHWRKVETNESRIRGVSEALTLGATISFIGFATLAALSHPLMTMWLGPGWDLASEFVVWLATGYAMQVPTALLANYLEITEALSRVHWIQFANALGLALGVGLLACLHDFRFLLAGFVLSQLSGLVTAVLQVSAALGAHNSGRLLNQLIAPSISAIGVGGVTYGVARLVADGGEGTSLGCAAQLCSGAFAAVMFVFLTRRWQPAFSILVERGVFKRP